MSKSMSTILKIALLLFVAVHLSVGQDNRPFRLDDQFNNEQIQEVSFSPDGQLVAFVRARPLSTLPPKALNPMGLYPREDIWLFDRTTSEVYKITDGETDSSKWWTLSWSPDGQRLAFLSTRGENIRLWVWETKTKKVRQASKIGVKSCRFCFYWVDDKRILFLAPAQGKESRPEDAASPQVGQATESWDIARAGEGSASVIKSLEFQYPKRSLFLLDIVTGEERKVANTLERHFYYPDFWPSPDGRNVALVSQVPTQYNVASSSRMGFPHTVEIRTVDGQPLILDKPLPDNIHTQTIKWSPDGKELAFFANGSGPINPMLLYGVTAAEAMPREELNAPMENPAKLYLVNIEKRTIHQTPVGDLDLGYLGTPDFLWTANKELVFHAPKRRYGQTAGTDPSRGAPWGWGPSQSPSLVAQPPNEWLVLDRKGNTRRLSKDLPGTPSRLWSINDGREMLGIADGEVFSVDPSSGELKILTEQVAPKVNGLVWPPPNHYHSQGLMGPNTFPLNVSRIVVSASEKGSSKYFVIDTKTAKMDELLRPAPNATISTIDPVSGNGVFTANSAQGSYLWFGDTSGTSKKLWEANIYTKDILKSEKRVFEYESLNREKLTASFDLPLGYKPGRRYPLIVNVYPARYASLQKTGVVSDSSAPSHPIETYTAAGFVYLDPTTLRNLPGISPRGSSKPSDEGNSCPNMISGVLPAVDKLIEMGIADPDRLFIEGASLGGWATLCIIGHTSKFKAAVGEANGPISDEIWPLQYGWQQSRYGEDLGLRSGYREDMYSYSNVPWWVDGERMRTNNPLTYADRIQTPVMLIHGDVDSAPIEFTEKFFSALVSMRKQAEFVRYWGEGHGNGNPSNIVDESKRRFAWYDRWGDIARDEHGNMIWDGNRVKGRNGGPPLKPEDYAKFDLFQPSPARQPMSATSNEMDRKGPNRP